ncbi:MAG: glycosyltransferase [Actinomycetota bacterium]|nr:glycosyltransferase [Actinomycetota bacterium]
MKLAFVTPRWGPGVLGGSEAVMAEAASGLASRGHEVDVLTTCALDHYSWENEFPEGASEEKGMWVRRFLVDRRPSRAALAAQISIQAGRVPDLDHQVSWLGFQFASPGLFEHVARQGTRYDALVFSPYLFWNTTACLPLVADRAVLVPCLHDEGYARLDIVRPVLALPALVWFLSGPEHELAHSLGPVARCHSVTGAGVPVPRRYDPEGFGERHGLRRPFVLYAGRREGGKGLPWLLEAFASAVAGEGRPERPPGEGRAAPDPAGGLRGLDLVIIGKGDPGATLRVPPELAGRVFDLGYLDDAERDNAFAAALAYLQPSSVESFSRTAMEAWLAGRPVVALASNAVLAWHCRRSGGGLLVSDAPSLGQALGKLASDPGLASELGRAGRRYVLENYTWANVLDRMEASLQALVRSRGAEVGSRAPAAAAPARAGAPAGAEPVGTATPAGGEPAGQTGPAAPAPPGPPGARRYLVAGSYPPVPGAPSAATLAAVRRAWAEGAEVVVASPRPSAAKHVLASNRSLGRQLAALGRWEGCDGVVLCIEPGWPLPQGGSRIGGLHGGRALADAVLGFARAEVVVTGTPRDLALELDALAPLWAAVHQVTASNNLLAGELGALATLGGRPPAAPGVRVLEPFAGAGLTGALPAGTAPFAGTGTLPPGCAGPLEPGELLLATRARRWLGRAARRALGRRAPAVRAGLEKLLWLARPRV